MSEHVTNTMVAVRNTNPRHQTVIGKQLRKDSAPLLACLRKGGSLPRQLALRMPMHFAVSSSGGSSKRNAARAEYNRSAALA